MTLKIIIYGCLLLLPFSIKAQEHFVSGTITDRSTGEPLLGTTIKSVKSGNIAVASSNGFYTLKLPFLPDTILVTHAGYIGQKLAVINDKVMNVSLVANEEELDAVTINTGYQQLKPNEVNGSFTVIDNKTLNEQTGTNILQRLRGVTSGLTFTSGKQDAKGGDNEIFIRGVSTINGPLAPLIIVDKFPYDGDIENINPNDVESVTILKDASAASIWGARAANGVIVITTKKSDFNKKLITNINSNLLITTLPDLFYQLLMPINDYLQIEEDLFDKGFFDEAINNSTTYPAISPALEIFLKRREGLINKEQASILIDQLKNFDTRKEYTKYFQRTGITQQHSLGIRGGTNRYSWRLSGNYNRVINTNNATSNKFNFHIDNQIKPFKNLTITLNAYYTNVHSKTGMPDFATVSRIQNRYVPYMAFFDEKGQPLPIDKYRREFTDTAGKGRLLNWDYFPLEDYKHSYTMNERQDIQLMAGLNYHLSRGLSANVQYQYQKQISNNNNYSDMQSYYTRNLINQFTVLPANLAQNPIYPIPKGSILSKYFSSFSAKNIRGQLNFSHSRKKHSVVGVLGGELREIVSGPSEGFTIYGLQEDPLSFKSVDFTTPYQSRIGGSYQFLSGAPGIGSYELTRFVSLYANTSYTFDQKYSLTGSLRKDASNVFGLSANDKWNPLWSSGVGWNVSKEPFYKSTLLTYLKLRFTLGYSGNVDIHRTALPVSKAATDRISRFPIQQISGLNNPSLRWEKSRQINLGGDFEFKDRVVTGTVEFYHKRGSDLYGETLYDYTTWGREQFIVANVANMEGRGIDLTLTTLNLNRAIKWSTTFIYNYNESKTTAYHTENSKSFFSVNNGNRIFPVIGKPLYSVTAYKWGGLSDKGDPQGYLDGELSTDFQAIFNNAMNNGLPGGSIEFIGPAIPVHFGSIINRLEWRGFSISMNMIFKAGYYFTKSSFTSVGLINGGRGHSDYSLRWQQPGDENVTNVPAFVYTDYPQYNQRDNFYINSKTNVVKGDHLRLHYLNVSYTFKQIQGNKFLNKMELYANATNLGILWRANNYKLDPDAPGSYPLPKQYTIGLRTDF